MSAIYLHIPFCKRLCGYCDFFKSVKLAQMPRVVDAMCLELVGRRGYLASDSHIKTIYFGGGTPSLLSADMLSGLFKSIGDNYCLDELEEVTIEVNPDDLTLEKLSEYRALGINRLSIGVQSFCDDLLKMMNRRHSASVAIEAVKMAQCVGFDNITIDLIFGVDGFGESSLRHSIDVALSLGVQHISAYHLTIEGGTPFARKLERGELCQVDDMVSQAEYQIIDQELSRAGYEHYEVSNYALKGYRSKHNSSYWQGVHYLGIGPGAHSYNGVERRYGVESIDKYLEGGSSAYVVERLSEVERYNEYIMTGLRCCEGVSIEHLKEHFAQEYHTYFCKNIGEWLDSGKLILRKNRLFIPVNHFLISDFIIESLFAF